MDAAAKGKGAQTLNQSLSPAERRESARRAAQARWTGKGRVHNVSAAKLAREIRGHVASIKAKRQALKIIADQALDAVRDADEIVATLETAIALLER